MKGTTIKTIIRFLTDFINFCLFHDFIRIDPELLMRAVKVLVDQSIRKQTSGYSFKRVTGSRRRERNFMLPRKKPRKEQF